MAGIEFIRSRVGTSERPPYKVMKNGELVGMLDRLSRSPGWTLVDATRAHWRAGATLEEAKTFARKHFKEAT